MRAYSWLIGLFILTACTEKAAPPEQVIQPVKVFQVQTGGTLTRDIPGIVRASQRVDLAFQVPGRLVKFDIKEGQSIKEGQLIGALDNTDYKASLDAARADAAQAKANYDRAQELIEKDFISKMDFDKLKAGYEIARSNLAKAEKAFRDTQLIAPFSGVVARKYVDNFEEVQAKQPIISLQDKDNLELVVNISENLLARAKDADRAHLKVAAHFDALPDQVFELFIKEFTTEANATTQTFQYVLGIKDRKGINLLPGMTANVTVSNSAAVAQAPTIPLKAVAAGQGDEKIVWLLDSENKVHPQVISLGLPVGSNRIQVTSGLKPGDVIAVAGLSALTDGLQVKPITEVRY